MNLQNYSFNCKNYSWQDIFNIDEIGKNCFTCNNWYDTPCKKCRFSSKDDEKRYQKFLEYIKSFPDEAFDQWHEDYGEIYNSEISGIKIYLSNPKQYAMSDGTFMWGNIESPSYVTEQWLIERLNYIYNQIALRVWGFRIFQLPEPCKKLDHELNNVYCTEFYYAVENEKPVKNCFICKRLLNGCSKWDVANDKLSCRDVAKTIMNVLQKCNDKFGLDIVCMYLEKYNRYQMYIEDGISKELQKNWADFISLILSGLLEDVSYEKIKKTPKRLELLKKEVSSKKYRIRIDDMIKSYNEFIEKVEKEIEDERRKRAASSSYTYTSSSYSSYTSSSGMGYFDPLWTKTGQYNWNRAATDFYVGHFVLGIF